MEKDLTLEHLGTAVAGRVSSTWVALTYNGGLINIDDDVRIRVHITRPAGRRTDEQIIPLGSFIKVMGNFGEEVPEASVVLAVNDHTTLKVCVQRITDFIFALHHFPLVK